MTTAVALYRLRKITDELLALTEELARDMDAVAAKDDELFMAHYSFVETGWCSLCGFYSHPNHAEVCAAHVKPTNPA